jgi:hypothetical protein
MLSRVFLLLRFQLRFVRTWSELLALLSITSLVLASVACFHTDVIWSFFRFHLYGYFLVNFRYRSDSRKNSMYMDSRRLS